MFDNYENKKTYQNRFKIAMCIYLALLIDNVLLTVIVPILPDYLVSISKSNVIVPKSIVYKNFDLHYVPKILTHPIQMNKTNNTVVLSNITKHPVQSGKNSFDVIASSRNVEMLEGENGSIGLLLAVKALVQLIFNPIIGIISTRIGYRLPIFCGTVCLVISSMVFAGANSYASLFMARAFQGVGSASIGVCGMSLVAQLYTEENKRSKVMGVVLGSVALGVLIGYPFGGILYDLVGKSAPFIIISIFAALTLVLELFYMDFDVRPEVGIEIERPKWKNLFRNKMIICIVICIWISTSSMAILEPCLPIWLLSNLKPKKWQLGTVFIPDSVGYFVGTNFFGETSYKFGQIKTASISLILVGISSIVIPNANTVNKLLLPHFGLGLGIGIIDAALVPMLASFVDSSNNDDDSTTSESNSSSYGTVYAVQQTSVSLAYSLGPLIGGEFAETIGFPWLMRSIGLLNLIYVPIIRYVYSRNVKDSREQNSQLLLRQNADGEPTSEYKRLYESID